MIEKQSGKYGLIVGIAAGLFAAMLLQGCNWVKPSEEAKAITVVKTGHTGNCKQLGFTSSVVKQKVGFLERKTVKVAEELEILAKNEAAKLGGDTVVPITEIRDGRQDFNIYKCL